MAVSGLIVRGLGGFNIRQLIRAHGLTAGAGGGGLSPGDEVQVLIAGGIECSVLIDSGTPVRVVIASPKQITVLTAGGTPVRVTI